MRSNKLLAIAVLLALPLVAALIPGAVQAAEQTGKFNGTVYDPNGTPLPGVGVSIQSNNLMGVRKTQTADDGSFLFFGLPPGKYSIEINQTGFQPFKQGDIRVSMGGTASMDIVLELPTAEETVVVTAKRPVVDKEKTVLGQNYDEDFLEEVPVGRSYQNIATMAPGVVAGSGSGNPNVHGGSLYSNQYLIDGMNTTDPTTNTFAANINYDAIKEFQILTGGLDAEYGQAMGGVVNLVTKSGGNEFHADATLFWNPDFMVLKDDFEKDAAGTQDAIAVNLNAGGPILKDRLWYFFSGEFNRRISAIPGTDNYFDTAMPGLLQHPERNWLSFYYLGKLTYQMTDKHKLTFMTQGDPTWLENELQNPKVESDAERQRTQGGSLYSLAWEAIWTKNLFQKTQVGFQYSRLHIFPMSECTDVRDEACRSHTDLATDLTTVNDTRNLDDRRYRMQFDSAWTYYLENLLGDHEAKAGWQYFYTWNDATESIPGGGYYQDNAGQPYRLVRLKEVNGELEPLNTSIHGSTLAFYLQDSWKLFKYLIVKPGLRFDYAVMKNYKDMNITNFLTTSPRINLVWDATRDGKTVIRAGYNRYIDTGYLSLSSFVGKSLEEETYEYDAESGQYSKFYGSSGGDDGVVVKDNLTAPYTDEVSIQIERELFTDFSVGLNAMWRNTKYIYEDDEANLIWNEDGTDVVGYKNNERKYIWNLGTPAEAERRYWGFELVANKAFSNNWQMSGSYTYSRAEGAPSTQISAYLDNPRQNSLWRSWLDFDRRHVIKLDGSYHFPFGIELGASVFWATGYPYAKYVMNTYWGGYNNLADKYGYDPDHPDNPYWNRFPQTFGLDMKVVWDLKELTGQQLDLITEMNNVLHLRPKTDLEENDMPAGSPRQYGNFYATASGFSAGMGIRYRY